MGGAVEPPTVPPYVPRAGKITCPRCGWTSHHPDDVREGYCGHCHAWTSPPATPATDPMNCSAVRLGELKTHAARAVSLWHVAQQKGQQPDPRHRDWWMGYHEAIKDIQSGSAPWPIEFLRLNCDMD